MDDTLQPHLGRVAGTRAAEDAIFAAFIDAARGCAAGRLSADVRRTVRPTEIANAAIPSAIKLARAAQPPIPADEFKALVLTITDRKAVAAARQATAVGRDARRTEGLQERGHADAAAATPADLAIARELAAEVTAWILAEPDDTKRLIRFFGLIQGEPPTDIRGVLDGLAHTHPGVGFRGRPCRPSSWNSRPPARKPAGGSTPTPPTCRGGHRRDARRPAVAGGGAARRRPGRRPARPPARGRLGRGRVGRTGRPPVEPRRLGGRPHPGRRRPLPGRRAVGRPLAGRGPARLPQPAGRRHRRRMGESGAARPRGRRPATRWGRRVRVARADRPRPVSAGRPPRPRGAGRRVPGRRPVRRRGRGRQTARHPAARRRRRPGVPAGGRDDRPGRPPPGAPGAGLPRRRPAARTRRGVRPGHYPGRLAGPADHRPGPRRSRRPPDPGPARSGPRGRGRPPRPFAD